MEEDKYCPCGDELRPGGGTVNGVELCPVCYEDEVKKLEAERDKFRRQCACLARGRERVIKEYGLEIARKLFKEYELQFGGNPGIYAGEETIRDTEK